MESSSSSLRCTHDRYAYIDSVGGQSTIYVMPVSKGPLMPNRGFEKSLLDAVDGALACLGESTRLAIYSQLENDFNIKREEIPRKIQEFADAIEKIFGAAAKLFEIQIIKKLHEIAGNSFRYFPEQDLVFTEYVTAIKLSFLNKLI
jgi:nucleoside-diphosphate-sugar epimerase